MVVEVPRPMQKVLLVIIAFLFLGVVVGIADDTGAVEKVVLAGLGALLVWAAAVLRRG